MDFKTASDRLARSITQAEIAEAAGVSLQTIRQARQDTSRVSHREPPDNWRSVVVRLARQRIKELEELIGELEKGTRSF